MRLISYWNLPLISGLVWLGTILGLLLHWIVDKNGKRYDSMERHQTIAYISDVTAGELKPLFITGCIITTVLLNLSFVCDYSLRHKGRLVPNASRKEKCLSILTIIFAMLGMLGLCLTAGFDTVHYKTAHRIFLGVFMIGYLLAVIFVCWEYQRLGKKNRHYRILRNSFWVKLVFAILELFLSIAFIVCTAKEMWDQAACLEWIIAFVFCFYVFSFIVDLYPAVRTKHGGFLPGEKPYVLAQVI